MAGSESGSSEQRQISEAEQFLVTVRPRAWTQAWVAGLEGGRGPRR